MNFLSLVIIMSSHTILYPTFSLFCVHNFMFFISCYFSFLSFFFPPNPTLINYFIFSHSFPYLSLQCSFFLLYLNSTCSLSPYLLLCSISFSRLYFLSFPIVLSSSPSFLSSPLLLPHSSISPQLLFFSFIFIFCILFTRYCLHFYHFPVSFCASFLILLSNSTSIYLFSLILLHIIPFHQFSYFLSFFSFIVIS